MMHNLDKLFFLKSEEERIRERENFIINKLSTIKYETKNS